MCNQETIEWAKDAANFLRQNGSYTHAERIIELCEYASSNLKEMTEDQARDYADMRKFQDRFISASRRIDQLEAELAEARRDGDRLDWLEAQCQHQKTVPQFWRNRNGKVSFAPWDEAKCVEADDIRTAIDAARKEGV